MIIRIKMIQIRNNHKKRNKDHLNISMKNNLNKLFKKYKISKLLLLHSLQLKLLNNLHSTKNKEKLMEQQSNSKHDLLKASKTTRELFLCI